MAEHPRIKVSYKGAVFVVKNYLDFTPATRDIYETNPIPAEKSAVLIALFEMTLGDWQKLSYVGLRPYQKLAIANEWRNASLGNERSGEEPDIVY